MPEVSLWDMKVDGEPLPVPDPQRPDPPRRQLTPDEELRLELPHRTEDPAWYAARKEEFEAFETSRRGKSLRSRVEKFFSKPDDVDGFLESANIASGPEAWSVLKLAFEKCPDRTIVNALVSKLWKVAAEWALHDSHRDLTMRELENMKRALEPTPVEKKDEGAEDHVEPQREYDDGFRYLTGDDIEAEDR